MTYVVQQYKESSLLRFHGNNGYANMPQNYIIHTLPTLFNPYYLNDFVNLIPIFKYAMAVPTIHTYVVGSKSFWPDIQKPRQMENAVRDI